MSSDPETGVHGPAAQKVDFTIHEDSRSGQGGQVCRVYLTGNSINTFVCKLVDLILHGTNKILSRS